MLEGQTDNTLPHLTYFDTSNGGLLMVYHNRVGIATQNDFHSGIVSALRGSAEVVYSTVYA
jgi:hypothetical protein